MTINEYLQDKTLTAVEIAQGIIFNLVCDNLVMGLDVDTSSVPSGTILDRRFDFILTPDTLSVDSISLNTNETNVLG